MTSPPSVHDENSAVSDASGTPSAAHVAAQALRRTLPPPEWLEHEGPRSAASLALERLELDQPVPRRTGPRAEVAGLRARLRSATAQPNEEAERLASIDLARALATRGTELDLATKLARRALTLGEDSALREELAGWFATLGEPALAAATLQPLVAERQGGEQSTLLIRIGVLLARAGEAREALEALERAMQINPEDPVPAELLGALGSWAPEVVSREQASEAYLFGSERRESLGDRAAAFENLIRAFECAKTYAPSVERLAGALEQRGRNSAADEVRREHARALAGAGRSVHIKRLRQALKDDDLARALGAAFDARLDSETDLRSVLGAIDPIEGVDDSAPPGFDGLLKRAGLNDLLAARVELACDFLAGRERARARIALGRLYAETLSRPERALDAWIDATVADPRNEEAKDCLRRHAATTRDYSPFVEALVRVGLERTPVTNPERVDCLRELLSLAEEKLGNPGLARWALGRLEAAAGGSGELDDAALRIAQAARAQDEELNQARAALGAAAPENRAPFLMRIAAILEGRPEAVEQDLEVLRELSKIAPDDRSYQLEIERLLVREGRFEELDAFLTSTSARAQTAVDRARARLSLANVKRRQGDIEGAVRELLPLLDESGAHAAAWSMALLLAAQRGDTNVRARALLRLASSLSPALRATLGAAGAEWLLEGKDIERARIAAEQACQADPSLARPVAVRAAVGFVTRDRWGADAMERAMGVIVPSAAICGALATAYDAIDEPLLATAWVQRRVTLRPGDLDAARDRLERAARAGDGARLADALSWLLSQPEPLHRLSDSIATALDTLATLAPGRASALARRALDVLGARYDQVREAVLNVADRSGERGLGIAALERWIATGSFEGDRRRIFIELAHRRRTAGDADGTARALLRAMREGAQATEVLTELDAAPATRTSDGELALLEARAETLSALAEADPQGTARAWRELGGALYDLAGDRESALAAWERSVALDSEHGVENFAADVVAFIGFDAALERLLDLGERQSDPQQKARCLAVAASVALGSGRLRPAFRIAASALEIDPSRTDVLAVAERSADASELDSLEGIYTRIADAALGCYGVRAIHYRAARQLERRSAPERALRHAVSAFEAVPSEGVVFVTMARLAERAGDRTEVVRAIERVALANKNADVRAGWLRRAALFTGNSEEGRRQRVDVLLRALSVRAETDLVQSLSRAMTELLECLPDEAEALELRFERAVTQLLRKVEGPEGARIGIEVADAALQTFHSARLGLQALRVAAQADGDLDEYRKLLPRTAELAQADDAPAFIEHVIGLSQNRFSSAGADLFEIVSGMAHARGDARARAVLLVQAACKKPEDLPLVRKAEALARDLGDPVLLEQVLDAVPLEERLSSLLELAAAAERGGNFEQAYDACARALKLDALGVTERGRVLQRALDLCIKANFEDKLVEVAEEIAGSPDLPLELFRRAAEELTRVLVPRGEPQAALAAWLALLARAPSDVAALSTVSDLAGRSGDRELKRRMLERLCEVLSDGKQRLPRLRELALLLDENGERDAAVERWRAVRALNPRDPEALLALEREAERHADWEGLARLLAERAAVAPLVEDVRNLRLRRARILDQQLGRADEARGELEALITLTGDQLALLLMLADIHERLGGPLRAAPLWLRASALTQDKNQAADSARRACEAYLEGGDLEAAGRVLEGMEAWAGKSRLLELAVKIERPRGRPAALADALDELASLGEATSEQRAKWLVEAARASLAANDERSALERAARAADLSPELSEAQLLARWLEYLARGAGNREQARETVAELRALGNELERTDAELRAFLIAEALDVAASGAGAGLRELERAREELGLLPLVALGLGERLALQGDIGRALECFDLALAGELRGVRKTGRVAQRAAEAARAAGERDRAEAYFELALSDPETRAGADAALAKIREERAVEQSRPSREPPAPAALSSEPVLQVPVFRASDELPIPGIPQISNPPASPPPKVGSSPSGAGRYSLNDAQPEPEAVAPEQRPAPSLGPGSPGRYSVKPERPERAERRPSRPPPSPDIVPPTVPRHMPTNLGATFVAVSGGEAALHVALRNGSLEAGTELMAQLKNRADRTHDLVSVCRRMATLRAGDVSSLRELLSAASADRDYVYVTALEHVLAVAEIGSPPEPPPLLDLPEAPDAVRGMLFREITSPSLEALALVWEGAEHVFRRDTSAYGLTGLERIPHTAPTPLARIYSGAARSLGMLRTPLFQRRSAGSVTVNLALLSPPAIVLSGDVREESPVLAFHLGAMLAASLPQFALLFGTAESQARSVLRGLGFAFGPPRPTPASLGPVLSLAELLWESIPARLQRRLRELCDTPEALDYDSAMAQARTAVRRAGLFVAGDFGVALGEVCADESIDPAVVRAPGGLFELCSKTPSIASLYALAISPEYAETRWRSGRTRQTGHFGS